jgi:hypothetical protein
LAYKFKIKKLLVECLVPFGSCWPLLSCKPQELLVGQCFTKRK